MPRNFIKINKNYIENHKKQSFFLFFIFIFIFLMIIFNIFNLFFTITVKKMSDYSSTVLEISSYNVYGLSICETSDNDLADKMSGQVSSLGGAGTIYIDGKNYILLSMYPTLMEAFEIKENLIEDNAQVKIITFEIPAISIDCKKENKNILSSSINFFRDVYNNLYSLSIDFDKNLIDILQLKQEIVKYIKNCIDNLQNLNKCKNINDKLKNKLIELLKNAKEQLFNLVLFKDNNQNEKINFSSLLKQTYINIIFLNLEI